MFAQKRNINNDPNFALFCLVILLAVFIFSDETEYSLDIYNVNSTKLIYD